MHVILKLFVMFASLIYLSPLCFAGGDPPAGAEDIIPVPEQIYGNMVPPIVGCPIVSDFWRNSGGFHGGIDFGSNDNVNGGEVIVAVAHGVAYAEEDDGGFASCVYIWHNDITYGWIVTRYGHMEPHSQMVGLNGGEEVFANQPIGIVGHGQQGNSEAPHLHFDIKDTAAIGGNFFNAHDGWMPGLEDAPNGTPNYANPVFKFLWDASYDFGAPIKELINDITKACTDGVKMIQDLILKIFWILVTIDIAVGASLLVIDSEKGNGIFKWLLYKLIMFGILVYFLTNWAGGLANVLRDFYIMVGGNAAGASFADAQSAISDPLKLLQKGAEVITPIMNEIGKYNRVAAILMNIVNIIFMLIFGTVILGLLAIITGQIVLTYIEFYMVMLFSFINFMFSGVKQTRYMASRSLNAIFAISVKLLFFCLFSLILQSAMTHLKTDAFFQTRPAVTANEKAGFNGNFANVEEFAAAIKRQETGAYDDPYNTYSTDGEGFGAYQISWGNWEPWCEEAGVSPAPPMPWPPEIQDIVAKNHMMVLYGIYGDWGAVARCWNTGSPDKGWGYWASVCNGAANGKPLEITIINFGVLLKLTLLILMFMIMGDRIGKSIIKQFSGKGFKFSNEDQA